MLAKFCILIRIGTRAPDTVVEATIEKKLVNLRTEGITDCS